MPEEAPAYTAGQLVRYSGSAQSDLESVLLLEEKDDGWLVLPHREVKAGPKYPFTAGTGELGEVVETLSREDFLTAFKAHVLELSRTYARLAHQDRTHWLGEQEPAFDPEADPVPYAGRVFNDDEVAGAVGSTLDFWLTLGAEGEAMEKGLAKTLNVRRSLLVNSGSSANLLALSALTSHKLPRARRLRPGDEVITCASGFPTTVAPIIQNGLVPVFIDIDPVTLCPRMDQLEAAYTEGKTKAVIFAHAMGSPFDLSVLLPFCERHELWLIEDNCDSLGSTYRFRDPSGKVREGLTGSFGDLSTQSFYPPHHLTMGEGGAVNVVRDMKLKLLVESFRDWGRDCWCPSGKDNTCRKRFGWSLGELPEGYDHKYIYSHLGYNLKPLDIQAAIGRVQLERLDSFIAARQRNWHHLRVGLEDLSAFFDFSLPVHASGWDAGAGFLYPAEEERRAVPSWFGFLLLVREGAGFDRVALSRYLEAERIGNRALFGGNLVRQPALVQLAKDDPKAFRTIGDLPGADAVMNRAVFIGVYPGLRPAMLDYMVDRIHSFCQRHA